MASHAQEPDRRPGFFEQSDDLLAPHAPGAIPLEMESWVQEGIGGVEIDEADADLVQLDEDLETADCVQDEVFKGVDEWEVMDAGGVVVCEGIAAEVVDD